MAGSLSAGWAARLRTIFGAALSEIREEQLQRLVDDGVREDADLDFKEALYGNGDSDRREFAADIAAMANDRGGILVIGVRDEADIAVELTPVPLDPSEEGRMRAIGASNIAPFAPFEILPIEASRQSGHGYYLVVVPPSPNRPHAVRKDIDLRYPRRHGASKRWLAESEVADAYRDRFNVMTSDNDRVNAVLDEGRREMKPTEDRPLFAIAIAPSQRGNVLIDANTVNRVGARVQGLAFSRGEPPFDALWAGLFPPIVRAGRRRLRIGTPNNQREIDAYYPYAELHVDGSVFVGAPLNLIPPERVGLVPGQAAADQRLILVTHLTVLSVTGLLAGAKLSSEVAGAFGDCSVIATLIGDNLRLVRYDGDALPIVARGAPEGPILSPHTLALDTLLEISSDLLLGARLLCSDLVQAFGEPELASISPGGELKISAFPRTYHQQLRSWAETHGIGIATQPAGPG